MKRIAALASGGGTNLQSLLDACASGEVPGSVVLVVSNNPDAYSLERARKAGVTAVVVDHRRRARGDFERELREVLLGAEPDLVCLMGWLRILSPGFFEGMPPVMNIHPALLPDFGGKGMHGHHVHEAVLASGAKYSGPTVHFVTPDVDAGPIILQRKVPVLEGDTPETLAARVLAEEHKAYKEAVRLFLEGKLAVEGARVRVLP